MALAERELGSFLTAVTELYGPQEARFSADDWLDELELTATLPGPNSRDWRQITIAASARLAARVAFVTDTKVSPIPSSSCATSTRLA